MTEQLRETQGDMNRQSVGENQSTISDDNILLKSAKSNPLMEGENLLELSGDRSHSFVSEKGQPEFFQTTEQT